MRDPPPEVVGSWPKPNYIDPETRGNGLFVVVLLFVLLCLVVVAARLYARIKILKAPGVDDVLIVISMVCTLGVSVLIPLAVWKYGWDRHGWDVKPEYFVMSRKLAWITEFLFVIATACTRASILFFYRKIIGRANLPKVKLAVSALLWFIIAYSVVFLLILLFGYRPLSAYWLSMDPSYTEYSGGYNEAISLPICAGISTVSDFGVLILPFFFVQGLQVAKGKKTALFVLFGMGIFTSIAGVIRVVYTVQTITLSYDETWGGYDLLLWTALENDLGIICASAPAMKPYINILEPYFRKFLSVLPRSTTKQLPQHLPTTNNYQHRGSAILTPPFQGNGQLGNESYVTSAGRANDTDHVTDGVLVEHEFSLLSTPKNNSCENADVKANIDILR